MQPLECAAGENPFQLRDRLERIMWTMVGVVRNGKDMTTALSEIQDIRVRLTAASGSGGPIYNTPWNEAINTENLSCIAEMLTRSALLREESRGAHFRSDFPAASDAWLKNICMKPLKNGDFHVKYTPVNFARLSPPVKGQSLKSVAAVDDE
jgi:succinate dehydrogenase/fumarate reductase flavoprotein subunit